MSGSVVPPLSVREDRRALAFDPALVLVPLGLFVTVVAVAAPNGSYFPSSWGWGTLVFLWAAAIGLAVRKSVAFGSLEIAYLGFLFFLLCWTAASLLWSPTTTKTMYEVERTTMYVAFAFALAVLGRRSLQHLLPALLAGIVAIAGYGLATRLLPDRVGHFDSFVAYRLSEPLGYWNAVSILVVIGIVVAVGLAARASTLAVRALSGASLVLLFPVLYFTFGRGGWLALIAGLAAAIAVDPRRLQLVTTLFVLAPWPALALWRAYESPSLTTSYSALTDASDEGRRLALTLAGLAVLSALATAGLCVLERRLTPRRGVRRAYGAVLAVALMGVVSAALVAYGGPAEAARRAVDSIRVSSPNLRGDQTKRLFSFSANGRLQMWDIALQDARSHPVLGSGAGTYERSWVEHRDVPNTVRDAHGIYFETLAELGPLGLAALLGIVAIPIAAAVRVRRHPLVAPALAGFAALAVHAGVDWDWEMPAVFISGLICAGVLLMVHAAERGVGPRLGARARVALVTGLILVAGLSFATLTGNRLLRQASGAYDRQDTAIAARDARRAARWAPWSTDALQLEADSAQLDGSYAEARRLYREAIAKDPGNWELWVGLSLASSGDARREALDRAAALNPLETTVTELRAQPGVRNRTPSG